MKNLYQKYRDKIWFCGAVTVALVFMFEMLGYAFGAGR